MTELERWAEKMAADAHYADGHQKLRRYDRGALNPTGIEEDMDCCIAEVRDFTGWHSYQCSRKRGYGFDKLYCKQHAKEAEKEAK